MGATSPGVCHILVDCFGSGDAVRSRTGSSRNGLRLPDCGDAVAAPAGRHALEVRVVWFHPRNWVLDENNIVPTRFCGSRRCLFMETIEPSMGTEYRGSRPGLSLC